jgi:cytoskeletal protein CcmA (bactofilin family)
MNTSDNNENKMASAAEKAVIGTSITIKGEISGSEDLFILGNVEGSIHLKEHSVTVGKSAKVNASIYANLVKVEGEVQGDILGRQQVIVNKTGHVKGNITAPRLTLEDGARLKGSIDTEPNSVEASLAQNVERSRIAEESSAKAMRVPAPEIRRVNNQVTKEQ